MYANLLKALEDKYEPVRLLKESPRGSVRLIRHKTTGQRFVLRQFTGSAEVYQRLLSRTCLNLPTVFEAVSQGDRHIVLEEFIEGDNLGELLRAP